MIPAAIHGKGTRGWDLPLLSKRTGCSPLAGCEEQFHFHCSGRNLLGEEQDSLWAGISPSKHRTKTALTESGNTPNPPAVPSWGCKGSAKPKENSDAVTATPKEKLLRAPNGQSCFIENTNDSALEWKFLFLSFGLSDLVPILQLESFRNVLLQARPAMPLLLSKF